MESHFIETVFGLLWIDDLVRTWGFNQPYASIVWDVVSLFITMVRLDNYRWFNVLVTSSGASSTIGVLGSLSNPYTFFKSMGKTSISSGISFMEVLEAHAKSGSVQSAKLLAQGEDSGSEVWAHVPVTVRLLGSRKCTIQENAVFVSNYVGRLFAATGTTDCICTEYWRIVGFDTVLSWMQGWVNPLFLAQQESGLILGRVAFQFLNISIVWI